jgi:hypothetical protein
METTRRGGAALVLALALGGCTVGTPSSAPTLAAGPSPAVSAAVPSSTPGPDVVTLLAEQFGKVTSGGTTMTGTLRVGDLQATFTSSGLFNGPDSTQTISTTVGGVTATQQSATVSGQRYLQVGEGPWLSNESSAEKGDALNAELKLALAGGRDLDAGAAGTASHTIEAADRPFDPSILGFDARASGGRATFTFEARPDGTPVSVGIDATWRQADGADGVDASLEMVLTFTGLNSGPRIAAPADVWERFSSKRWAFSGAHPSDFDLTSDDELDLLVGVDGTFVTLARGSNQGSGLNVLANSEVALLKRMLDTRTVTNDAIAVGGLKGRLLSAKGTSRELGGKVVVHEAIAVQGKFAYVFLWVSKASSEATSLATFRQLISTIAIDT